MIIIAIYYPDSYSYYIINLASSGEAAIFIINCKSSKIQFIIIDSK